MRIAKRIAHSGVCSRRKAEELILQGKVCVNGNKIETPAFLVGEDDLITIDGKPLPLNAPRLWIYYKPEGLITTHHDPQGRPTVFDNLPKDMPPVISVGRLDLNSEGLLILTTSRQLAKHAESPQTGWERTYKVRVYGNLNEKDLLKLSKGATLDGIHYKPFYFQVLKKEPRQAWMTITLIEGKNREIRNLMEAINLQVSRLIRFQFGPFELEDLKPGEVQEISFTVFKKYFPDVIS